MSGTRILTVFEQYLAGGFETHLDTVLTGLIEAGAEVYTASGPDFSSSPAADRVIEHLQLDFASFDGASVLSSVEQLVEMIRRRRIDVLHIHPYRCLPAAVCAALLTERPFLLNIHAPLSLPELLSNFGSFFVDTFGRLAVPYASRLLAVSEDSASTYVDVFGADPKLTLVARNPISMPAFEGLRNERKEGPVALYASRLDADKASSSRAALGLLAALHSKDPAWRIVVAGAGQDMTCLVSFANSIGLSNVEWVGMKRDMLPLYAEADLVIGMNRVILEGLAAGRLSIVSNCEGLVGPVTPGNFKELQKDNFLGSACAARPAAEIADSMPELMAWWAGSMAGLREQVRDEHDSQSYVCRLLQIYQEAISAPRRGGAGLPDALPRILDWLGKARSCSLHTMETQQYLSGPLPLPGLDADGGLLQFTARQLGATRSLVVNLQRECDKLRTDLASQSALVTRQQEQAETLAAKSLLISELLKKREAELEFQERKSLDTLKEMQAEHAQELAAARAALTNKQSQLDQAQAKVEELLQWTESQRAHILDLKGWTEAQELVIRGLAEKAERAESDVTLRMAEKLARSEQETNRLLREIHGLEIKIHGAGIATRIRRAVHAMLDALQQIIPASVRSAVRPVYLKVYRRLFPTGRHGFEVAVPDSITLRSPSLQPPASTGIRDQFLSEPTPHSVLLPALAKAASTGLSEKCGHHPLVSVVLPVWNQVEMLAEAIESVLAQTYRNLELIVVDDGSEQDLEPALRKGAGDTRFRVVRRPHAGLPSALSCGFRHTRGELLTWTSADNRMRPRMIEELVRFMVGNPAVVMTYANMDLIDERGVSLYHSTYRPPAQKPGDTSQLMLSRASRTLGAMNDNFIGACFMYRSWVGRMIGDYDAYLLGTEDYDYWLRVGAFGPIEHLDTDECLYSYRVHDNSLSGKSPKEIGRNAVALISYHRERTEFLASPATVFIRLPLREDPAMASSIRQLIQGFEAAGCTVSAGATVQHEEDWLNASSSSMKRLRVSFQCDSPCDRPLELFNIEFIDGNDLSLSDPFLSWALCPDNDAGERMPAQAHGQFTLFPCTRFSFDQELLLAMRASDNRYPLWDLPEFAPPLFLYLGPLSDECVDWAALNEVIKSYPDATYLFISTAEEHCVDPRSRLANPNGNVVYLGCKPQDSWHQYLSRAQLLLAPFRDSAALRRFGFEVMVSYLAAGKPVLASPPIRAIGFGDAPGVTIEPIGGWHRSLSEVPSVQIDYRRSLDYLETKSFRSLAAKLVMCAGQRLFFRKNRSIHRPGPRTAASSDSPSCVLEVSCLHRGGLERTVASIARGLRSLGWKTSILVTEAEGDVAEECRRDLLDTELVTEPEAIREYLRRRQPDVLVPNYSFSASETAWRLGIPVVSVIHNNYIWADAALDARVKHADLFVHSYVAVSSRVRLDAVERYHCNPDKIHVIPNGIDIGALASAAAGATEVTRATLGLSESDFVLLNVASILGTKAQLHAVSAVRRLSSRYKNLRLLLMGEPADRTYAELVRAAVKRHGLEKNVLFCGHTNRIADYYSLADAFLLCSLTEGWSLAKTEAMYSGLPLILTDVGGARDVIQEGDIGIVIPPAYEGGARLDSSRLWEICTSEAPPNLGALINAIDEIYTNRDDWRRRGLAGRRKVAESFGIDKVVADYDRFLRSVLMATQGVQAPRSVSRGSAGSI